MEQVGTHYENIGYDQVGEISGLYRKEIAEYMKGFIIRRC